MGAQRLRLGGPHRDGARVGRFATGWSLMP
jgi:hypothetical protein